MADKNWEVVYSIHPEVASEAAAFIREISKLVAAGGISAGDGAKAIATVLERLEKSNAELILEADHG